MDAFDSLPDEQDEQNLSPIGYIAGYSEQDSPHQQDAPAGEDDQSERGLHDFDLERVHAEQDAIREFFDAMGYLPDLVQEATVIVSKRKQKMAIDSIRAQAYFLEPWDLEPVVKLIDTLAFEKRKAKVLKDEKARAGKARKPTTAKPAKPAGEDSSKKTRKPRKTGPKRPQNGK